MIIGTKLALFIGGTLFGSAGFKLLSSKDARKVYTHVTAAALRCKDQVMKDVELIQDGCSDILADAKQINSERALAEEAEIKYILQERHGYYDSNCYRSPEGGATRTNSRPAQTGRDRSIRNVSLPSRLS